MSTMSEMLSFWNYEGSLPVSNRFSYILQDNSQEEDASVTSCCNAFDLALGLNCEYLMIKGFRKPERYSKITHYMNHF